MLCAKAAFVIQVMAETAEEADMPTPKQKLEAASNAISTAAMVLKMEMPTFEAFLEECRDMDNFGHIVDPTLYNKSERKAVSALLEPMFKAAVTFVKAYDAQLAEAQAALKKVAG